MCYRLMKIVRIQWEYSVIFNPQCNGICSRHNFQEKRIDDAVRPLLGFIIYQNRKCRQLISSKLQIYGYGSQEKCQHGELPRIYEVRIINHYLGYIGKLRGVNMREKYQWIHMDTSRCGCEYSMNLPVQIQIRSTKIHIACSLAI